MKEETLGQLFFSAKGRINRQKFFLAQIALIVIFMIVGIGICFAFFTFWASLTASITPTAPDPTSLIFPSMLIASIGGVILFLLSILASYSFIVLNIKRWHDLDKSGWFTLSAYIPGIISFIIYLCIVISYPEVAYDNFDTIPYHIILLIIFLYITTNIICPTIYGTFVFLVKGTEGENQFGEDPLADKDYLNYLK